MNNLIWKQWQESKNHLWIFSAWMILVVCYSIAYEIGHKYRAVVGSFSSLSMLYATVAAIVLAARASHGEQTDGTLSFTKSLPVSIRRVAAVRIVGAIMTLAIPVVVASLILAASLAFGLVEQAEPRDSITNGPATYIQIHLRPVGSVLISLEQVASVTAITIMGGVEMLLVLSLCGCWMRNQAQVGLLGAVMALCFLIATGLLWFGMERWPLWEFLYGIVLPQSLSIHWSFQDATGGYQDHELAMYRWLSLGMAVPFLGFFARCYILQYGRSIAKFRQPMLRHLRFSTPSFFPRLAIPLPTRWIALVWLELRQSIPMACYGLLFASLMTIAGQLVETGVRNDFAKTFRSELPGTVFFVGILWAVVVGSSLFSSDLDSKLGAFRRSRPISHAMWFWNKFFVGLIAVLLVMDVVTILVSWNAPRTTRTDGMSYAYVACFPIIHSLMYSLAVLGMCLFRQPLLGGLAAILSYAIATMAVTSFPETMQLEPTDIYSRLLSAERSSSIDFTRHSYPFVFGFLAAMAVVCAAIAFYVAKPLQRRS